MLSWGSVRVRMTIAKASPLISNRLGKLQPLTLFIRTRRTVTMLSHGIRNQIATGNSRPTRMVGGQLVSPLVLRLQRLGPYPG